MEIEKKIPPEEIPENLKTIMDIVGNEKFMLILDKIGGEKIYLPQKGNFELKVIRRLVYEEASAGKSVAYLSEKYHLDKRTVRKYIRQETDKRAT